MNAMQHFLATAHLFVAEFLVCFGNICIRLLGWTIHSISGYVFLSCRLVKRDSKQGDEKGADFPHHVWTRQRLREITCNNSYLKRCRWTTIFYNFDWKCPVDARRVLSEHSTTMPIACSIVSGLTMRRCWVCWATILDHFASLIRHSIPTTYALHFDYWGRILFVEAWRVRVKSIFNCAIQLYFSFLVFRLIFAFRSLQ